MRIQKFLIIPLLIGSSLSPAFSQTQLPPQKTTGRFGVTAQQLEMETKADTAEAKAKRATKLAAAIKQNIAQLHKTFTIDPKVASQKRSDLNLKLAQVEADGAKARAEAASFRAQSVKEQAAMAAKNAQTDASRKEDSAWLQQLAATAEQDLVKAEAEAARKSKIAAQLTSEAQSAADAIAAKKQEQIRQARAEEEAIRRTRESLLEQLKTGNEPAGAEPAEDPLVKALREKQAELDARGQNKSAIPQMRRDLAAPSIPVSQSSSAPASTDPLIEVLRQKQVELNAREIGRVSPSVAVPAAKAELKPTMPNAEDQLVEVLRKKQAELNAREGGMASPSLAAPMKRERGTERPQSAVVQPSSNQTSEQELVETLRKKQTELDAKENKVASRNLSVPATTTQTEREQSEQRIRMIESQIKAQQRSIQKAPAIKGSTVNKAESLTPESEVYRVPKAADLNSKEARLDELLRKYRADEITPREYHMERAKIIAEP